MAALLSHSDPQRALDICDHALRHLAEIRDNPSFRRYEAEMLSGSALLLHRLGRAPEARQRLNAAFDRLSAQKLYPSGKINAGSAADKALRALAGFEAARGNLPRAPEIYRQLLDQLRAAGMDPASNLGDAMSLSNLYRAIADLRRRIPSPRQAEDFSALRLELWRGWEGKLPGNTFVRRQIEAASHF